MDTSKQSNPLEYSDSKNKPSKKIVLSITKQELWKKIRCANQAQMTNELNEIIYNNRITNPTYIGYTRRKIIATNHILISELKLFLTRNDLPLDLFD